LGHVPGGIGSGGGSGLAMPRVCAVCDHPERTAIDQALVRGESVSRNSALFRVSTDSLERHKANHLPKAVVKAQEVREVAKGDDLLREVRILRSKAYSLLLKAEEKGDLRTALGGIREARGCLELLAKLLGELDERPQINVLIASTEWTSVRGLILKALLPYPEARVAVAEALDAES
jgi:hypothetical protein